MVQRSGSMPCLPSSFQQWDSTMSTLAEVDDDKPSVRTTATTKLKQQQQQKRNRSSCFRLFSARLCLCPIFSFLVVLTMMSTMFLWALLFLESGFPPPPQPDLALPSDEVTQQQRLGAWNEFCSTMVQSMVYQLKSADEKRQLINALLRTSRPFVWGSIQHLSLRPSPLPADAISLLSSGAFVPTTYDIGQHRFDFSINISIPLCELQMDLYSYKGIKAFGLFADADVSLKVPNDRYSMELKIVRAKSLYTSTRPLLEAPLERRPVFTFLELFLLQTLPTIPLMARPTSAELRMEELEKLMGHLEEQNLALGGYRGSYAAASGNLQSLEKVLRLLQLDRRRAHANVPPAYARTRNHQAPGDPVLMVIPEQIAALSEVERVRAIKSWRAITVQLIYTLVLNESVQKKIKALLNVVFTTSIFGISMRLVDVDLGMNSIDDMPNIVMEPLPPDPYTYAAKIMWSLPKSRLTFALDGLGGLTSLETTVSSIRLSGKLDFEHLHPLLVRQAFLSLSFRQQPDFDFDVHVNEKKSHLMGWQLIGRQGWKVLQRLMVKPLINKVLRLVVSSMTKPMSVHIPWIDDPGEMYFSTATTQKIFRALKLIFSAQGV